MYALCYVSAHVPCPPARYTDVGERYKDTYIPLIDEDIDDEDDDDEGKVLLTQVKCH